MQQLAVVHSLDEPCMAARLLELIFGIIVGVAYCWSLDNIISTIKSVLLHALSIAAICDVNCQVTVRIILNGD